MDLLILLIAGAMGGFIAGLVGVGGGIIFGPILFFYFQSQGLSDPVLTPLTLGTSLLCTFLAALSGAIAQHKMKAIDWRTAAIAGAFATVAVTLLTLFVTTKSWYSKEEFQVVLGIVLATVAGRMFMRRARFGDSLSTLHARRNIGFLALIGAGAGAIAATAGIGGGVIMVPAFNGLVRLPLRVAAGTSNTAITFIALTGSLLYAIQGIGAEVPSTAWGYVDLRSALLLGVPAIIAARFGVSAAHRINIQWVRYSFAAFASVVAIRLIWNALVW